MTSTGTQDPRPQTQDPSPPLFVSLDDHLAGFKIIEVEYRAGAVQELKLTAPTRRATRQRLNAIRDAEAFPWEVVALCLGEQFTHEGEHFLDQLTPDSAALVEVTAFALTFGAGVQKKIEAATLAKLTASASSAPSSASSPADGHSEKSSAGAGPSSSSAPRSPKSPSSLTP